MKSKICFFLKSNETKLSGSCVSFRELGVQSGKYCDQCSFFGETNVTGGFWIAIVILVVLVSMLTEIGLLLFPWCCAHERLSYMRIC